MLAISLEGLRAMSDIYPLALHICILILGIMVAFITLCFAAWGILVLIKRLRGKFQEPRAK